MANKKTPEQLQEENTSLQEQLAQANEKLKQAATEKEEAAKVLTETQEQLAQANEKLKSLEVGAKEFQTLVNSQKEQISKLEVAIAANGTNVIISSSSATSTILTKAADTANVNAGLTKVKISYPSEYKEEKHFKDGDEKFVSKESANHFVKLGIATIVD